jgi:hypothetical protein
MRDRSLYTGSNPVGTTTPNLFGGSHIPCGDPQFPLLSHLRGGSRAPVRRSAVISLFNRLRGGRTARPALGLVFSSFFAFLALSLLSACASDPLENPPSFGENLRGKHKQEILACAGPPDSQASTRDGLTLVYTRSAWAVNRSTTTSEDTMTGSRPRCRATITLQDDRVVRVEYQSIPESAQALDHCDRIFFNCGG